MADSKLRDGTSIGGVIFQTGTVAPSETTRLNCEGYFYATRIYNAVYNDLAEYFESDDEFNKLNLVYVLNEKGNAICSYKRADNKFIGIASDTAAIIFKQELKPKGIVIALSGTVKVKYDGEINIGDEVVSYINGRVIKASEEEKTIKRDTIIGKVIKILENDLVLVKV